METEQDVASPNCPEVALWRAVIHQAMLDLHRVSSVHANCFFKHKRQADRFFFGPTVDLQMVCDFADLDMSWVVAQAKALMADPRRISDVRRKSAFRSVRQKIRRKPKP